MNATTIRLTKMVKFFAYMGTFSLEALMPREARSQSETSKTVQTSHYHVPVNSPGQTYNGESFGPIAPGFVGSPHLFGTWGGIQPWLVSHGIFLGVSINEEYSGNPTGGLRKAAVLAGQFAVSADIDWDRLADIDGLWSHILVINRHGNSIARTIGDTIGRPQQIYGLGGNVIAHLVAMWADKTFMKNRLILSAGWIPPAHMFHFDYLSCAFMNVAVCGTTTPNKNLQGGKTWPSGNFGAVVFLRTTTHTFVRLGTFGVTQSTYTGGISGWSWGQKQSGVAPRFEVGWEPSFGSNHLSGMYKMGVSFDSSPYNSLYEDVSGRPFILTNQARKKTAGVWSSWLIFHQMLIRQGSGLANGLIVIGGAGWAQGNVSPIRDHEWLGLLTSGTSWKRPLDQIGLEYQVFNMSRSVRLQQKLSQKLNKPYLRNATGAIYGPQKREQVVETFYSLHVATGTALQFDFQYLFHPNASAKIRDASVLGMQFTSLF